MFEFRFLCNKRSFQLFLLLTAFSKMLTAICSSVAVYTFVRVTVQKMVILLLSSNSFLLLCSSFCVSTVTNFQLVSRMVNSIAVHTKPLVFKICFGQIGCDMCSYPIYYYLIKLTLLYIVYQYFLQRDLISLALVVTSFMYLN